jgi:hypothetical protein
MTRKKASKRNLFKLAEEDYRRWLSCKALIGRLNPWTANEIYILEALYQTYGSRGFCFIGMVHPTRNEDQCRMKIHAMHRKDPNYHRNQKLPQPEAEVKLDEDWSKNLEEWAGEWPEDFPEPGPEQPDF